MTGTQNPEAAHVGDRAEFHLVNLVPGDCGHAAARGSAIPTGKQKVISNFVPLNESGETIDNLELADNQQKLEDALKVWLRTQIKEIEVARLETPQPTPVS